MGSLKWIFLACGYATFVTLWGYLVLGSSGVEGFLRAALAGLRIGTCFLPFALAALTISRPEDVLFSLRSLLFALFLFFGFATSDALGLTELGVFAYSGDGIDDIVSLGGFNRTSTGTFAQFGIFVTLILYSVRQIGLGLTIAVSGCFGWLLLISLSRSNYLSTIVMAALMIASKRRGRLGLILVALVVGISSVSLPMTTENVSRRLNSMGSYHDTMAQLESTGRLGGWEAAAERVSSEPRLFVFGAGFDMWQFFIKPYSGIAAGHNVFLSVLGEMGALGLSLFLGVTLKMLLDFWRRRDGAPLASIYARGGFSLLLGLLVANITTDILYPTPTMGRTTALSYFILGVLVCASGLRIQPPRSIVSASLSFDPKPLPAREANEV